MQTATPETVRVTIHAVPQGQVHLVKGMKPFLSSDPTRSVLALFGVQAGYLCACDGHRAVRVKLEDLGMEGLPEGTYRATFSGTGRKATAYLESVDGGQYPNMVRLYPTDAKPRLWSFTQGLGGSRSGQALGELAFKLATVAGATVDADLLAELPEGGWEVSGVLEPVTHASTEPDKARGYLGPLRFQTAFWDVLIMPCRR